MSIERGQAAGASAAVPHRPGASKNPAQAAASGDFLALLAALDAMLPAGGEPGLTGEGTPDGAAPQPQALDALAADLATPLPADAAAALAAADAAAAAAAAQPATPSLAPPPLPPATRAADAAPQPIASADACAQRPDDAAARPAAPVAAEPAAPASLAPQTAPQLASVFEQLKSRLAAQEAATPALADAATAGTKAAVTATAQAGQRDARGDRGERGFSAPLAQAAWARAEPAAMPSQAFDQLPARSALRGEQAATSARAEPGTWAPQDFTPTVQYDAAFTSADAVPPPAAPDEPLAEQLRYWVSQGLRSAELTVQGDADPVQVSISMQGNEAHVSFRSEQAATREMLSGSTDQLRELLQAQGMVLSGVSVGAHDAGGRGGAQQDAQARTRAAAPRLAGVEPAAPGAAAAAARTAAGGLDLYV